MIISHPWDGFLIMPSNAVQHCTPGFYDDTDYVNNTYKSIASNRNNSGTQTVTLWLQIITISTFLILQILFLLQRANRLRL